MDTKRVVVALGMHRSGTSALTRGLTALNVDLGDNLIGGIDDNNPKGYWEDIDIHAIDNAVLARVGARWDSLRPIEPDELRTEALSDLRLQALELLQDKLRATQSFGFKDPRLCRLMPFWQEVFRSMGLEPAYILALRNPLSIGRSLAVRDGFAAEKSYMLWTGHMLAAMRATEGATRLVVDYDALMADPVRQIKRMARTLSVPADVLDDAALSAYTHDFLARELTHSTFPLDALSLDSRLPRLAAKLHLHLHDLAHDRVDPNSDDAIRVIRDLDENYLMWSPIFSLLDQEGQARSEVSAFADQQRSEIDELRQSIAQYELQIGTTTTMIEEQTQEISRLMDQLSSRDMDISRRDQEITVLTEQATTSGQRIAEIDGALVKRDSRIGELEHSIRKQEHLISGLGVREAGLQSQLTAVYASRSWRITAPLRKGFDLLVSNGKTLWGAVSGAAIYAWRTLPISFQTKEQFKDAIFPRLAPLIDRTEAYRVWFIRRAHGIGASQSSVLPSLDDVTKVTELPDAPPADIPARLIAFYLPQFHPIPENDAWWGKGFTEWTNVRRATTFFPGHEQPRLPGELGYYDLVQQPGVQHRQVELAKLFGIGGFCFYFYWFGGKRLLETPILTYLQDSSLDMPFCLCWANENWSRRWDGLDKEILIGQNHSPEDDIAFIQYISRYFSDPRSIRIKGKLLLLVYRPSLLPSPRETAVRWREWCRDHGIGELYLVYPQSFESVDPSEYGFDAAIEFPPNNTAPPIITTAIAGLSQEFRGTIYDWTALAQRSENYVSPTYPLFRGVCPSWDNTARRQQHAGIFYGSSPRRYQRWLRNAIRDTVERFDEESERLVFINAWNEWAEGAYLEPDDRYGYAYLTATANALRSANTKVGQRIVYVSHDACFNGAQLLSLHIVKALHEHFGYRVDVLLLGGGPLIADFSRYATVHDLSSVYVSHSERQVFVGTLYRDGVRIAIASTSVVGDVVEMLKNAGIAILTLVHELPQLIRHQNLEESLQKIARFSDRIWYPANVVREKLGEIVAFDPAKTRIRPQGLYHDNPFKSDMAQARRLVRSELGLPEDAKLVLAMAYGDHRKGVDLFVDVALQVIATHDAYFVWIGSIAPQMWGEVQRKINNIPFPDHILFPGERPRPEAYFSAADVYLLPSREDPFPSVVLASMDVGVPVVGFENAGGFCDLLRDGAGMLVPYLDFQAMSAAVSELLDNPDQRSRISLHARQTIETEFRFLDYVYAMLQELNQRHYKVSVIIPNYNYERYLPQRLESIVTQSVRPYEIIFLDDCSIDDSLVEAKRILSRSGVQHQIVANTANQGTFRQWLKGIDLCRGEIIWIAEADDYCTRHFLSALIGAFDDPEVQLAYCQSKQIDEDGHVMAEDYTAYTRDIDPHKWLNAYVRSGRDEISDTLFIKNSIPNVSGVLMRKPDLSAIADRLNSLKIAGDWLTYVHVLGTGKISYIPDAHNFHRRHAKGATLASAGLALLKEILQVQAYIQERYFVTETTESKRNAYLQEIYEQFHLNSEQAPFYWEHPNLEEFAGNRAPALSGAAA